MARKRNPKRDEAKKLYDASGGMIKLVDLAAQLGVAPSRIRKWKSEDKWERSDSPKKERSHSKRTPSRVQQKLLDSVEANEALTENRRLFCLYYATSRNALQSYLKAYGGSKTVAGVEGCRLLKIPSIQEEVKRLRNILCTELDVNLQDLLRYCLKVVSTDIGDFVRIRNGGLVLQDSERCDTSLIEEVKEGKAGVSIKLADKKWAWEKLETYLGWQADAGNDVDMQNYVDALKGRASEVWADEATETTSGDV